MSFKRGGKNIKIRMMQAKAPASLLLSIYAESVNMLEGLTEEEAEQYFTDHTDIILLYEINVDKLTEPYQIEVSQVWAKQELGRAREALEKELAVSQHVKTDELEEVDLSEDGQPWPIMVAKHLPTEFKKELTQMLQEYKMYSPALMRRYEASIRNSANTRSTYCQIRYLYGKGATD